MLLDACRRYSHLLRDVLLSVSLSGPFSLNLSVRILLNLVCTSSVFALSSLLVILSSLLHLLSPSFRACPYSCVSSTLAKSVFFFFSLNLSSWLSLSPSSRCVSLFSFSLCFSFSPCLSRNLSRLRPPFCYRSIFLLCLFMSFCLSWLFFAPSNFLSQQENANNGTINNT